MTIPPCTITSKDGRDDWCEECQRFHHGHAMAFALGTDAKSEHRRKRWRETRPMKVEYYFPPKPVTFLGKAWNYIKALFFHTINGFGYADWPTVWKRRKTCNACPKRDPKTDSCRSCGCSLSSTIIGDKLRWASSVCPEGKW